MRNQDEKLLLDATGVTSLRVSTIIPTILVAIMWVVKIIEVLFHLDFSFLGVKPVSPEGIPGIFLFHFIHGDWEHLFANTIPILVLGSALYYFYRPIANRILLILILSVGLLTWCGARGGVHIGASGLVYGLTFFLMLSGFIRKAKKLIIISLVVVFLYGSLVWGLYPKYAIENNISWEGHLSGFVMGIVLAIYYKGEVWYGNENGDENGIWDDDDDCDDDIDPETQKPYWDVPEPDKDELTVKYRFRN